jgi:hypothetical protein
MAVQTKGYTYLMYNKKGGPAAVANYSTTVPAVAFTTPRLLGVSRYRLHRAAHRQ